MEYEFWERDQMFDRKMGISGDENGNEAESFKNLGSFV